MIHGATTMMSRSNAMFNDPVLGDRRVRRVGLYALVAVPVWYVISSLLALAYFATDSGASELEVRSVSAWADPGRDLAGGLLTFASADTVYFTYLKLLLLASPAVLLCALLTRSRRPAQISGTERLGWRLALTGYSAVVVGPLVALPWDLTLGILFFALIIPGTLLSMIGSTLLGVAFLRSSYRPRLTAILLVLSIPFFMIGSAVLGHNSLGQLIVHIAWGVTGWRFYRSVAASSMQEHDVVTVSRESVR